MRLLVADRTALVLIFVTLWVAEFLLLSTRTNGIGHIRYSKFHMGGLSGGAALQKQGTVLCATHAEANSNRCSLVQGHLNNRDDLIGHTHVVFKFPTFSLGDSFWLFCRCDQTKDTTNPDWVVNGHPWFIPQPKTTMRSHKWLRFGVVNSAVVEVFVPGRSRRSRCSASFAFLGKGDPPPPSSVQCDRKDFPQRYAGRVLQLAQTVPQDPTRLPAANQLLCASESTFAAHGLFNSQGNLYLATDPSDARFASFEFPFAGVLWAKSRCFSGGQRAPWRVNGVAWRTPRNARSMNKFMWHRVGKTTSPRIVLHPRLPNCEIAMLFMAHSEDEQPEITWAKNCQHSDPTCLYGQRYQQCPSACFPLWCKEFVVPKQTNSTESVCSCEHLKTLRRSCENYTAPCTLERGWAVAEARPTNTRCAQQAEPPSSALVYGRFLNFTSPAQRTLNVTFEFTPNCSLWMRTSCPSAKQNSWLVDETVKEFPITQRFVWHQVGPIDSGVVTLKPRERGCAVSHLYCGPAKPPEHELQLACADAVCRDMNPLVEQNYGVHCDLLATRCAEPWVQRHCAQTCDTCAPKPAIEYAFATLVTEGGPYINGAMALAQSVRSIRHSVQFDLVAIVTRNVPMCARESLQQAGWRVWQVDEIPNPFPKGCGRFCTTYTKLRVWQLPYSRVVFLDADTLVVAPLDSLLLDTDFGVGMLGAVDHQAGGERHGGLPTPTINSGVLLLSPSNETFTQMIQASGKIEKAAFIDSSAVRKSDQSLLHMFFQGCLNTQWPHGKSCRPNMMKLAKRFNLEWRSLLQGNRTVSLVSVEPSPAVLHFSESPKPWNCVHSYRTECQRIPAVFRSAYQAVILKTNA